MDMAAKIISFLGWDDATQDACIDALASVRRSRERPARPIREESLQQPELFKLAPEPQPEPARPASSIREVARKRKIRRRKGYTSRHWTDEERVSLSIAVEQNWDGTVHGTCRKIRRDYNRSVGALAQEVRRQIAEGHIKLEQKESIA